MDMKHFIILFYFISFTVGFAMIFLGFFVWLRNRQQMLKLFLLSAAALTLILLEQMITAYVLANVVKSSSLGPVLRYVSAFGCGLLVYSLTLLVRMLTGKAITKRIVRYVAAWSLLPPLAAAVFHIVNQQFVLSIASAAFFFNILYNLALLLLNSNRLTVKLGNFALRLFLIVSLLMFPILLIDVFIEKIDVVGSLFPFGLFSVVLYYILFSGVGFFYLIRNFNALMGTTIPESGASPVGDKLKGYHITSREREVIELLVLGLSYQRISERLVISIPTVKTHVSNIYKKLGVRNKIELMNVVRER